MESRKKVRIVVSAIGAITAGTFLLDVLTPLGMAVWILYLCPIGLTYWLPHRRAPLIMASICSVLTLLGLFYSPSSTWFVVKVAVFNRAIGLCLFWITAFLLLQNKRVVEGRAKTQSLQIEILARQQTEEALRRAHDELERRVQERTVALATANEGLKAEIAERNRAKEAIRESEERFRLMVEGVTDYAILMLDPGGHIVSWNVGAQRLKGYQADEIIGQHFSRFYLPEDIQRGKPEHELTVAAAQGRFEDEGMRVRKDGSRFWANVVVTAMRDEKGTLYGFSKMTRDITERKRAEEQLLRKNRDLETLLYVTSHDLREPLRSIENFSRMVHDRYAQHLDEKGLDFLRRVVRGAKRMDRLLADILALSRAQRMESPTEEVEGESIAQEALLRLESLIKESGAKVRVAKNLPRLRVNRTWATQGVYNLVANALKYTRDGEPPDIEIVPYEPGKDDPSTVGLIVRDRGSGVAPEHAERIFQLFQRAVGREVEGTGAGLAIVRQVAERHGGRAWVQPREGGGSEFVLTFGSSAHQKGGKP